MNKNQEVLLSFIESFEKNPLHSQVDLTSLDDEYIELGTKIKEFIEYISSSYEMSLRIAAGDFTTKMTMRNPCAGPLKEIQSILHHLTWQVERIADGDYSQSVDYLGELSDSFNNMISKLKNREYLLIENARLKEEVMNQQNMLLEHELQNQTEKYRQFSDSVEELKSYRHDMKNHMLCLDMLLQNKEIEEARKYITSISTIFQTQKQEDYGENYIFGALLHEKLKKAKDMNVIITKNIDIHRKLHIENKDWCTIFANALDNALEALAKVDIENRYLKLTMKSKKDILTVKIANRMVGKLEPNEKGFKTTKKDKYLHGLGINNIRKTVEKYHGEMKIDVTEDEFILIFIIFGI